MRVLIQFVACLQKKYCGTQHPLTSKFVEGTLQQCAVSNHLRRTAHIVHEVSSCPHAAEMLNMAVCELVTQSAAEVNHMAPVNIIQSAADVVHTSSVNIHRGTDVFSTPSVNIFQRAVSILHRLYHSMCRRRGALDFG
jgi:hypothetical protein